MNSARFLMKVMVCLSLYLSLNSSAVADDFIEVSPEQFRSEWRVVGFPEILKTADGTPLIFKNVRAVIEWEVTGPGQFSAVRIIEETPTGKGYAQVIVDALMDSRLEPLVDEPLLPIRARGEFVYQPL